ncbi:MULTISPECIES: hypothetical protein [unclassified Pseudarthrobacter]|uniref:hypothetical protein n=1 Tax=unclassified Pseudarthrobacter TaxID=2647000 RepID=UPI0036377CBF
MNFLVGIAAVVIGALGFWQRDRIAELNRGWNRRMGKPGEIAAEVGTAKYFGIGAILMILAGVGTIIFSLVTGQMGGSSDRNTALVVIIIAAVGFVVLGTVFAVMLFKRRSKQ